MIVRDEAERIERLLESVRAHVDYVCIADTGSDDDTVSVIRDWLRRTGIAGEVVEHKWVDFATNRQLALNRARGHCDYILVLDADQALHAQERAFEGLQADAYTYVIEQEGLRWRAARLIRDGVDLRWNWIGAVHERLVCEQARDPQLLDVLVIAYGAGGERTGRYKRDVEVMERMLIEDPSDAHTQFHLANTYQLLGRLDDAARLYQRLIDETSGPASAERRYVAMWQMARCQSDVHRRLHLLQIAHESRPARMEASHEHLKELAELGRHQEAFDLTGELLARPLKAPDDQIMVAPWVYAWGIVHQRALAAARTGHLKAAERAFSHLLGQPGLPEAVRTQSQMNLERVRQTLQSVQASAQTGK